MKNWSLYLNLFFGLIILSAVLYTCNKDKEIESLRIDLFKVYSEKDSLGNVINVKNAQIVDNQSSMKELRAKLFETTEKYNKKVLEVKALIALKSKVEIDSVFIPYEDSSKFKKWSDSVMNNCRDVVQYYEDSSVLIGTQAKDSSEWYQVEVTVKKKGIEVNNLVLVDSQYIALTEFKGGLFKKDETGKRKFHLPRKTKVEVKHTNPHFKNTGVDGFFYEPPRKNNFGKGVITGAAIIIGLLLL